MMMIRIVKQRADIKLTLNPDTNVPSDLPTWNRSLKVRLTVLDDDAPELSVSAISTSIIEADNVSANFKVSAEISPNKEVTVRYHLTDSGDFIAKTDTGIGKTIELDFRGGKWSQRSDDSANQHH